MTHEGISGHDVGKQIGIQSRIYAKDLVIGSICRLFYLGVSSQAEKKMNLSCTLSFSQ